MENKEIRMKLKFFCLGCFSTIIFMYLITITSLDARESQVAIEQKIEAIRKLANVFVIIEQNNIDDLNYTQIADKAIQGLMNELDAHSSYFSKKSFKEFKIQTEGEFGGLGITVGMRDKVLTIISPIDNTPAYRAGLKAGDIILKINEQATLNMTLDEAVSLMRGKPKTPIELTILRKGKAKPFKVKIIRDIIKIQSVFVKTIDKDILYIRIASFDKKVVEDVKKALKEKLKGRKGIILDLRSNPGGLLSQAVGLVDLFVDDGIIVSQRGRNKEDIKEFKAHSFGTYKDIPMVVLIDPGSASASEIVSGSLQDHKRAIIVGEKSFGKGSVQAIWPITPDQSEAIKLTIARYYLPSGRTIQAKGVTPDIQVFPGKVPQKEDNLFELREENLKKHLEGELKKVDGNTTDEVTSENNVSEENNNSIITQKQIFEDLQLKTAIDIVRSLALMQGK